jgi:hypothetical protein
MYLVYEIEDKSFCRIWGSHTGGYDSSTLKVEAVFSFGTSINFQRTTRRYIPEESTLQEGLRLEC